MPPRKRKTPASGRSRRDSNNLDEKKTRKEQSGSKETVFDKKVASKSKDKSPNGKDNSPVYSHWLVKSEPDSRFEKGIDVKFSFEDLKSSPDQTACWDGVRNYSARNFLRDQMKNGHDVFFYHSNCKEPGIVGICKVVKESYPDHTQFDSKDPHYDSSCKTDNPKWFMVDVKYVRPLKRFISLAELKKIHQEHARTGGPLSKMAMFTRARLSVQPIANDEWDYILTLEDKKSA
ncbi:thymocyte nuclear protein 1 [Aplysia californica]|uniref:Thymocyte nuclear protein 1 n=1 Tax=Aplysia californica TaxID=6500 RepID=A0ABM0JLV0_APLCA|nr:thymocyte nuclear protein 1 [Aplysia californica]